MKKKMVLHNCEVDIGYILKLLLLIFILIRDQIHKLGVVCSERKDTQVLIIDENGNVYGV